MCGRAKEIIIVNGRKYHPQDLEWAVDDIDRLRRGRVVAFGDTQPGAGDRVVLVVETSGTATAPTLAETIRRRISDGFGLYVDEIVAVPSGTIGRTTSGKVQRAATKAFSTMQAKAQLSARECYDASHGGVAPPFPDCPARRPEGV